jgi:hypothetical protein
MASTLQSGKQSPLDGDAKPWRPHCGVPLAREAYTLRSARALVSRGPPIDNGAAGRSTRECLFPQNTMLFETAVRGARPPTRHELSEPSIIHLIQEAGPGFCIQRISNPEKQSQINVMTK